MWRHSEAYSYLLTAKQTDDGKIATLIVLKTRMANEILLFVRAEAIGIGFLNNSSLFSFFRSCYGLILTKDAMLGTSLPSITNNM